MTERTCEKCHQIGLDLRTDIHNSAFGKIMKQCSECKTTWVISKDYPTAVILDPDTRIHYPKKNRLAFINDPRRRRPQ